MFSALDGAVFSSAERFCHWWQRLTGLTNFWWARMCGLLFALQILYTLLWIVLHNAFPASQDWALYYGLYAFMGLSQLLQHQKESKEFQELEDYYLRPDCAAHPTTLLWREMQGTRLFILLYYGFFGGLLCGIVFTPPNWQYWSLIFPVAICQQALSAATYFRMVIPLPPGVSTVRKLLDSWSVCWTPPVPASTKR